MALTKKFKEEFEKILGTFFNDNGGFSNGFNTFVRGTVSIGPSGEIWSGLKWGCPNLPDDLTIKEYRKKGDALGKQIGKLVKTHKMKEIKIIATDVEWGCYNHTVTWTRVQSIDVYTS